MIGLPELPTGWAWSTVQQVGRVQLGRQRSPKNHQGPHMRPYLRVANVFEDRIDTSDVMTMNFEPEEFKRYRLQPGDVLLNEGQSPELLGRPAIYRGKPADTAFTNSLIRFQGEDGIAPEWALVVFRRHMHYGRFSQESRITTNIAHLSANRFKTVEFPVPPADEQRRIVESLRLHLEAVDRAVEALRALQKRVNRLVDVSLNHLLNQALETSGSATRVGVVCEISGGIQKQPKRYPQAAADGIPFLRVANVGRRVLHLNEVHRILITEAERDRALLRRGDLLVVEGNGSPDQIGRAAAWGGQIDPCTHQNHLIRVRPGSRLDPEYLELVWNAPTTISQLKAVASTTSGLYTLSTRKLAAVQLPVPPLAIQCDLVRVAKGQLALAETACRDVAALLERLVGMRRALLNAAFSGKLVPQDDADVSAGVLLTCIVETRESRATALGRTRSSVRPARKAEIEEMKG